MTTTTTTSISALNEGEFAAEAVLREKVLAVTLTGNADLNVKVRLDGFFAEVHDEAQRLSVEEVEVDVRRLDFMNSSCLKCLVGWISRIQEQPAGRQYKVSFKSSPTLFWQRRSLHALSCLAADLVSVQV